MFIIGYALTALVFLAVGLSLLILPDTYFAVLDRMARVNLWARPRSSWDPKAPRWRALGTALALFALLMILGPPLSVYLRSPEEFRGHPHAPDYGVSWGAVLALSFFLALGVGFLARPLIVFDKVSPHKHSTESNAQQHAHKLRIFGGLLLLVALLGMWVQLSRYLRH